MRKRLMAVFLCLCLLFTLFPATAFASGEDSNRIFTDGSGPCEHHTQHDGVCGYTEGTAEIPCSHEHNESCGGLTDPEACNHTHKVNGGEADKEGGLGRDEACGYVPATEGTPCTFVCEVCNAQDSGDVATPFGAQPEECTCEALCTQEEINADCPVCSAEGAELDKVCVGVAPMLPVTELAAPAGGLYVGNYQITSSDTTTYLKAGLTEGSLTEGSENDWTVKYDPSTATLTLSGATITGSGDITSSSKGAGIYAQCNSDQSVSLTIELIGNNNTITGSYGIYVNAEMDTSTYGIDASLTITSEYNGSLEVSGSNHGIFVKSGTGKASLTINDASVVAKTTQTYSGYAGVYVQSSSEANSPQLSLTVNGGSLTASGGGNNDGIQFYVGAPEATNATTSLIVTDHAIVDAKNGGISAKQISNPINTDISATGSSGIVFNGNTGTVYGDVELQEDITIGEGESLTIGDGASLNTGSHEVIVNGGTLNGADKIMGTVKYAPTITTQPKNVEVKENETATFTVKATGTEPLSYQWQQSTDNGKNWTNIASANAAEYTTGKTTMDMNGTQYRCVVKNSIDEVTSSVATLTVQKATTPIEPKYVRYIVEHYKQNTDGSYNLAATEQPIDEIGKTVTATPKTYEGYTYNPNAAETVVSGTLKAISSPDDIVTLKLYYDITLYTVTINGSYAQTTGAGSYAKDSTVTIDAGTRSGYTFVGWTSEDGVIFANAGKARTTFTMPEKAVTVTANWMRNPSYDYYIISASAGTGGSISPSGSISVREGLDKTFIIIPDSGWRISDVLVDGKSVGAVTSYTFDNVQMKHTIEATFKTINGIIIEEDGTIILPGEDLESTADDIRIEKGKGTENPIYVSDTESVIIKEGNQVILPSGDVVELDAGSQVSIDGTITEPDGTVITSDGVTHRTDGAEVAFDGTVLKAAVPVIHTVEVSRNTLKVILNEQAYGAQGYDFVISTNKNCIVDKDYYQVNKNISETETDFVYVQKGVYYAYCHSWIKGSDGKKTFSSWSEPYEFEITDITPEAPVIQSIKKNANGTITVTTVKGGPSYGYDIIFGTSLRKVNGEIRPVDYGNYVAKNRRKKTLTFPKLKPGTYYISAHAFNAGENNQKVFSPWSNIRKIVIK